MALIEGDDILTVLARHGDEAGKLYELYGDEVIDVALKYGDDGLAGIQKYGTDFMIEYHAYGDEFVENYLKHGDEAIDAYVRYGDDAADVLKGGSTSPKGLIGHDFEDYLTKNIGGDGSFSVGGRDFDGGIGNRWWEAKSGNYWNMIESDPNKLAKFKSDMGDRLKIATENGAAYELFSNTPIPDLIKQWLDKKGIAYTELLN